MATILNKSFLKLQQFVENADKEAIEKGNLLEAEDSTFAGVFTADVCKSLKVICGKFQGFEYPGKTFEIYEGPDSYGVSLPSLFSNGSNTFLEWGGTKFVLDSKSKVSVTGRLGSSKNKASLLVDDNDDTKLRVRVVLKGDSENELAKNLEALDEVSTWGELEQLLIKRLEILTAKTGLFEKGDFKLKIVDAEIKTSKSGEYWSVECMQKDGPNVYIFLPERAKPQGGKMIKVNAKDKCLEYEGEKYSGGQFLKLGELDLNVDYHVTAYKEKTGEYAGLQAEVRTTEGNILGWADCNSKLTEWLESNQNLTIDEDNPVTIRVIKRTEQKSRTLVKLKITAPKGQGISLDDLLGSNTNKPPTSAKVSDTEQNGKEPSNAVDEFDEDADLDGDTDDGDVFGSKATTNKAAAISVQEEVDWVL